MKVFFVNQHSGEIIIVGAGVLGRLAALRLLTSGCRITLLEGGPADGSASCSWVGAGMLAPWCERESADAVITAMGMAAMPLWREVQARLGPDLLFEEKGSLVVAHGDQEEELAPLRRRISADERADSGLEDVGLARLAELEPDLQGRFRRGLFFPHEGQVSNRDLIRCTNTYFAEAQDMDFRPMTPVARLEAHRVVLADGRSLSADWVLDCRGLGAREAWPHLRGVRGELVHLHAPEVTLTRPVRMMHPRYPLYIVPRRDHCFVIGATQIESESRDPITVRSALELLSAAYALHSGFAEATLTETLVQWRPAFPDHHPRVEYQPGLLRANGLYRHGFLLSPYLVEAMAGLILHGQVDTPYASVLHPVNNPHE